MCKFIGVWYRMYKRMKVNKVMKETDITIEDIGWAKNIED